MDLEGTQGSLRELGNLIVTTIKELSRLQPEYIEKIDWYKAKCSENGKIFIWFRFIGKRARRYPPESILIVAKQDERLANIPGVKEGNNLYGPSHDMVVRAGYQTEAKSALEFIKMAFNITRS